MNEIIKETGFFESFDGSPIYFEKRGQGKPLVLLYGIGCSSNHWRYQLQYFSKNYQTIVMDYRGHQHTPLPKDVDNLNIETLAKDVSCLLHHLNISKASFWSHSFGSQVLLSLYQMNPEIFANIIFINAFAANPLKKTFGYKYALKFFSAFKFGYDQMPVPLTLLWKLAVNNPLAIRITALAGGFNMQLSSYRDLEIYSRGVSTTHLKAFTSLFERMIAFNGIEILPTIKVPTLIMAGSKDTVTPPILQQEMHEHISRSEFLVVPLGSHCTPLDIPELVNLRIEKFLTRVY
jgi:pimeloyl-ACP methyl ester carboxylesterase